jgi:aspartate aminotransferase
VSPAAPLRLSRRARRIEVSPTVATFERAAALRRSGERVLDFSVGEPDQATPRHIVAAANAALLAGKTRYTPAAGMPELRAAVAARYAEDYGADFRPEEVFSASGGKHALYSVCQCLLEPGDEVIVPSPYWPTFSETVRLAGARPIVVPAPERDGFRVTPRLVKRALTPRTKAVILDTPCNPTGAALAPEDLLAIGRLARRHGFALLYDDTYAALSFAGGPPPLRELRRASGDRLVVLGTSSKSYCMTGWRIGWLLGPQRLVEAVTALASHSTQCPTSFAQHGAIEALSGPQQLVRELREEYQRRRDALHPLVAAIPGVRCSLPEGAFYLFPNVAAYLGPGLPTSIELAARLLEEERLALVPGEGFGAPGYLRLSFARPLDELVEGAGRLRAFLSRLPRRSRR